MNPEAIVDALDPIHRSGRFAASGHLEDAPLLKIEGFGTLPLPVVPALLPALRAAGTEAPYGRGPDTLTDPTVRRCHQLGADRVRVPAEFQRVVEQVAREAGEILATAGSVEAHLYKLLVYGPGDFFVPHRDTEKRPGMFGTLVLTLPAELEGGEIVVHHAGQAERFTPGVASGTSWVAFYADCSHEVLPLHSGVRVALVYNLVRPGAPTAPLQVDHDQANQLDRALQSWSAEDPVKLAYVLEHRYSAAELTWDRLKGPDHGRAHALRAAAARTGRKAYLARLSIDVEWNAEELQYRSRRHLSRTRYDGWGIPADLELYEVVEERRLLTGWLDAAGTQVQLPDQPFLPAEVWPAGAIDDEAPDDVSYHEATGNEGASLLRAYRRCVVVLWPEENADRLVAQRGLAAVAAAIEQVDDDQRVVRMVAAVDHDARPVDGRVLARVFRTLAARRLHGPALALFEAYRWHEELAGPLATLMEGSSEATAARLLSLALLRMPAWRPGATVALLRRARPLVTDPRLWRPALDLVAERLPRWSLTGQQLAVLISLAWELDQPRLETALEETLQTPEGFDRGVDAALELHSYALCPDPWRARITSELIERTASRPVAPGDRKRAPLTGCGCADCAEVSNFLRDPGAEELLFSASKRRRSHVASRLSHQRIDVRTRERRQGNPHKLLIQKTNAHFETAIRRHREHVDALSALCEAVGP